jgi:hypothetical protein
MSLVCQMKVGGVSGLSFLAQELDKTDNKVALIWKHQLMQFNNLSLNMAAAIVSLYPSPAHLLQVLGVCITPCQAGYLTMVGQLHACWKLHGAGN